MTTRGREWPDRLPKAPLAADAVAQETGVQDVFDWIRLFNGFQTELPELFATVEVIDGPSAAPACEALRALRRRPILVPFAKVSSTGNRMWNVSPILQQMMQITNPGTAIDLGCGAGRDSVWLAANGWEVTAVDRLENNIDALRRLRAAYAPDDPIHWVLANLSEYRPEAQYELVLLHYCWDPNYFDLAKKCVAPGGLLSILAHSETHYRCFGHPRESKVVNPEALVVEGFEIIACQEFWSVDRHSASLVLKRTF